MAFFNSRRDPYRAGVSWLCSVWLFSLINAGLYFISHTHFVVGLVMTQLLLALPIFANMGIVLIVLLLGLLVGCWHLARNGKEAALLVASLIYLVDLVAMITLVLWTGSYGDFLIDFAFHVLALVMMLRGFIYGMKSKARVRSYWQQDGGTADDQENDSRA